jgi:hypothetical protein
VERGGDVTNALRQAMFKQLGSALACIAQNGTKAIFLVAVLGARNTPTKKTIRRRD